MSSTVVAPVNDASVAVAAPKVKKVRSTKPKDPNAPKKERKPRTKKTDAALVPVVGADGAVVGVAPKKERKPRAKKEKVAAAPAADGTQPAVAGETKAKKERKPRSKKPKADAVMTDAPAANNAEGTTKKERKPRVKKDKATAQADAAAVAAAGTKKTKKRSRNDEPKIPRAVPGYVFFSSDNWNAIAKANPEAKFPELSRITARTWKSLSADQKAPYLEKAAQDRTRYERMKSENKRPAAPCNAYINFCNKHRDEVTRRLTEEQIKAGNVGADGKPKIDMKAVQRELGAMWAVLPKEEKIPFEKIYEEAKIRYKVELEAFKAQQEARKAALAAAPAAPAPVPVAAAA